MAEMILEPLAVRLRFAFPDPIETSKWAEITAHFLEELARRCLDGGPCLIGHIKALALLDGGGYIRVSVVSESLPAQIETNASAPLSEITIVLIALVYGLSNKKLQSMLEETIVLPGADWSGRIVVEPGAAAGRIDPLQHLHRS